jgi:hypothetical protein
MNCSYLTENAGCGGPQSSHMNAKTASSGIENPPSKSSERLSGLGSMPSMRRVTLDELPADCHCVHLLTQKDLPIRYFSINSYTPGAISGLPDCSQ